MFFSDPGAPETIGANNYVHLGPGDGERVAAFATFNNQLFAFKQTRFYVFYGNSTDGTGQPIFNYRTVDTGVGMQSPAPQSVCVGDDGVYFIGNDGIYRTTGGPPVCIARAIDPFFAGDTNTFWQGGEWDPTSLLQRLAWLDGHLYAALPTVGGSGVMMVWDSEADTWTMWAQDAGALCPLLISSLSQRRLIIGSSTGDLLRVNPGSAATDAGAAFASRYRSAFNDFGDPRQKMIRHTIMRGTGTPTLQWSRDRGTVAAGSAVTLGTSPAVATGRQSKALPGRKFSFQVGAASGAWAVNQVQPHLTLRAGQRASRHDAQDAREAPGGSDADDDPCRACRRAAQGISPEEIVRRVGRRRMPAVCVADPANPWRLTVDPVALDLHMRTEASCDFEPAYSFTALLETTTKDL